MTKLSNVFNAVVDYAAIFGFLVLAASILAIDWLVEQINNKWKKPDWK